MASQGGTVAFPTQARKHDLASTSDNDGAGTEAGASSVEVIGLDSNYERQSETVALNGTTNAPTTNSYIRLDRMKVLAAGSNGSKIGTITATAQTDSTVTNQITIGENQSLYGIFTIPANKTGYMTDFYASADPSVTATITVKLKIRPFGQVWQTKQIIKINDSVPYFKHSFNPPLKIDEKSDVKITVVSSANNQVLDGGFDIIYE